MLLVVRSPAWVQRAGDLLRNTDKSVSSIALRCGYKSDVHYTAIQACHGNASYGIQREQKKEIGT